VNLRKTAVIVLLLALVLVVVWGCGKKKADTGEAGTPGAAEGEGSPLAGEGPTGGPGGMAGPGAGPPGAGMAPGAPGRGAGPAGMGMAPGAPGRGAGPAGMGMAPGGLGTGPPAASTGPAVTVDELIEQGIEDKNAGRLEDAEMKLRAAVLEEESNEDAHWALAWTLALAKKKSEAIAEFKKVLELTADAERTSEAKAAIRRLQ